MLRPYRRIRVSVFIAPQWRSNPTWSGINFSKAQSGRRQHVLKPHRERLMVSDGWIRPF